MPVALVTCRRHSIPQSGTDAGKGVTGAGEGATASAPASASASARAAATAPDAGPPVITRRDGAVSVDPDPACEDEASKVDAAAPRTETWLSDPEIQAKRPGEALERELENWKASVAGTYLDDHRRALGIVLHRDFADYDALQQKLEPISGPLKVVLRPACYSRKEIENARRVIDAKEWHARAKDTWMISHFDASISAFSVSVDDSTPEVAKALEQRLGKLVRTRLGKMAMPQRRPPRRPSSGNGR